MKPQEKLYKKNCNDFITQIEWDLFKSFYWQFRGQLETAAREPLLQIYAEFWFPIWEEMCE